jgi:peptidoglycan/xylan/chitin deacetylase (PgdA/CDA1 family)
MRVGHRHTLTDEPSEAVGGAGRLQSLARMTPDFGALILSLDFEIHWGVRDVQSVDGRYRPNLLGVRQAIPAMLELFEEFEAAATWATVGFLFARSRAEARAFTPSPQPRYRDRQLNPYNEPYGENEEQDPFHFAPSLISRIRATPRQEIATHTFSHYYCLAEGQDRETFKADLDGAIAIARRQGIELRSIVFPRNEHNPNYDDLLRDAGITCFRGNEASWLDRPTHRQALLALQRGGRIARDYVTADNRASFRWNEIREPSGLANVRATSFLRPFSPRFAWLERRRLRGLSRLLERSAIEKKLVHLWWHPHNFGVNTDENIRMLRSLLEVFAGLRSRFGMKSLSMGGAAALASVD